MHEGWNRRRRGGELGRADDMNQDLENHGVPRIDAMLKEHREFFRDIGINVDDDAILDSIKVFNPEMAISPVKEKLSESRENDAEVARRVRNIFHDMGSDISKKEARESANIFSTGPINHQEITQETPSIEIEFQKNAEDLARSDFMRTTYGKLFLTPDNKPLQRNVCLHKIAKLLGRKNQIKELLDKNETPTRKAIVKGGCYNILSLSDKLGIRYNEIVEAWGKKKNRDDTRWRFLHETTEQVKLTPEESFDQAKQYYLNCILPKCIEKGIHVPPSRDAVNKMGFVGFNINCQRLKIRYSEIVKAAGFNPNKEKDKWKMFFQDETGRTLNHDERIKKFADYFLNLFPDKDDLQPFTWPRLRKIGEEKILETMKRAGVKINEINKLLNRNLMHDMEKWKILDFDEEGRLLDQGKRQNLASKILVDKIIPVMRELHGLGPDEIPTVDQLKVAGFGDFMSAISCRKMNYNGILKEANLIINHNLNKWKRLDKDEFDMPISHDQGVQIAAEIFKKEIIPELIKKNIIEENQTPTKDDLSKAGFNDFVQAITYRGLTYNYIVIQAGLKPNETSELSKIGINMHTACEKILLEHGYLKNFAVVNEQYLTDQFSGRCDISIIIDQDFLEAMKDNVELVKMAKELSLIHVDFFLGNSSRRILDHCYREYQNDENMLILVPSMFSGDNEISRSIPHQDNVLVLSPDAFSDVFGLKGKLRQRFKEIILLANDATWKGDEYKEDLQQITGRKLNVPMDVIERNKEKFKRLTNNRGNIKNKTSKNKEKLDYWIQ